MLTRCATLVVFVVFLGFMLATILTHQRIVLPPAQQRTCTVLAVKHERCGRSMCHTGTLNCSSAIEENVYVSWLTSVGDTVDIYRCATDDDIWFTALSGRFCADPLYYPLFVPFLIVCIGMGVLFLFVFAICIASSSVRC